MHGGSAAPGSPCVSIHVTVVSTTVSGLASDERPSLTTSSLHINPHFDSIEEQKKTIMTAISSIGDSILEWADPGSQIRGHTEVRRSVGCEARNANVFPFLLHSLVATPSDLPLMNCRLKPGFKGIRARKSDLTIFSASHQFLLQFYLWAGMVPHRL